jgi:nucleoside-diphosphate-sugar epimerase
MNATPPQVIFGTGAIGLATMEALRRRGERVRLVNRSGTAPVPDDVEVLGGDAGDPAFATAAADGAQVLYQTLNPPYHRWVELFPGLQASVLAAAQATGARLVSMENVYAYGRPAGQPLTETHLYAAHTKKGRLRAGMARDLLAAHQAGRVQVAIGRASDYFGPRGGAQSNLGDRVIPAALAVPMRRSQCRGRAAAARGRCRWAPPRWSGGSRRSRRSPACSTVPTCGW